MDREMRDGARRNQFRVLVVDRNPLMRFALLSVINLHPLLHVCEEAADARSARTLYTQERPNIVVLDIALPNGDGIELMREFTQFGRACQYVVVSEICEAGIVQRAFEAGAGAYVSKSDEAAELLAALEATITGRIFIGKVVSKALEFNASHKPNNRALKFLGNLSDREMHIFRRIGKGERTTAIAKELGISIKTVETHQAHIKRKLQLGSSLQLRRIAEGWFGSMSACQNGIHCIGSCPR